MSEYVELFIDQGSNFDTTINIADDDTNAPQNLSGIVVTSQLRRSMLSVNAAASFVCSVSDTSNGEIYLEMSAANTSNLKVGTYFFDVRLFYTGENNYYTRLIEGVVHVTPGITR